MYFVIGGFEVVGDLGVLCRFPRGTPRFRLRILSTRYVFSSPWWPVILLVNRLSWYGSGPDTQLLDVPA